MTDPHAVDALKLPTLSVRQLQVIDDIVAD
jgi:hypothetical protein